MSKLAKRLRKYGLDSPNALATAIDRTRQRAAQLLSGERFGILPAKAIARAINVPWQTVLRWQDNGGQQ